jgi:hypothetical protein
MTKRITKSILILVPAAMIFTFSSVERDRVRSFFEVLEQKLELYNRNYYNEKAYLTTDRFVYRPGEDIWFRGFVSSLILPHGDSSSADFYIKFINSKGDEIVSRRYPLYENQVSGRFLIPRTSIPGKYYLVAYTGWMKNQDPSEAFRKEILIGKYFDKRFQVEVLYDKLFYYPEDSLIAVIKLTDHAGKPLVTTDFEYRLESFTKNLMRGSGKTDELGNYRLRCRIPMTDDIIMLTLELKNRRISGEYTLVIPASNSMPEITFYSEDGNLVQGIDNYMAFRSKDEHGLPVSIKGEIIDSEGHLLQTVTSDNMGLGSFTYQPQEDTCYLRITKPVGIDKLYPLPKASRQGTVLHLRKLDPESAFFSIRSVGVTPDSVHYWVALLNRRIVWKKAVPFQGSAEVTIPLSGLLPGIMQVSVFNAGQQILAERVFYIQEEKPVLIVKTDKLNYQSRQRVFLTIDYLGESNTADISAAVSLRQLAYNPLNADFGEYIYSFPYDTLAKWSGNISSPSDNSLLTYGYSQVNWIDILNDHSELPAYKRQDGLSGIITDKKENEAQHAKVRVTHITNFRFYETQTNDNGRFQILFGSDVIDLNYLNIDAYDALGKVNLVASINQDYSEVLRKNIRDQEENRNQQKVNNTISFNDPDVIYSLRYGSWKYRKSENEIRKRYDPNLYSDFTSVMDIIQEIKPFMIKDNVIVFSDSGQTTLPAHIQEGVIIVINGMLKGTHIDVFRNLLPSDVTNINISTSLNDVHRYTPINFQGVIELTTIQGMYRYRQNSVQMGTDILNSSREFYSPDYSIESPANNDNRRTLYWNPQITLRRGQSILLTFFTSDIRGVFYGSIEGTDEDGNPIRSSFTILAE